MATIITRIHDLDGDLVLNLSKATGYRRISLTAPGGSSWRFSTTSGPYVDGEAKDSPATRAAISRSEVIRVLGDPALLPDEGAYWRSVEDRIEALVDATADSFLWAISDGGYLWTYRSVGPANVTPISSPEDMVAKRRPVTLTFKCQPNPTKATP